MKKSLLLAIVTVAFSFTSGAQNIWTQIADYPGSGAATVGFSINDKGYVGTGWDDASNLKKDFWEYNPSTDNWTQVADFGGTARIVAVGFSIGDKGYVGTGYDDAWPHPDRNDFWEYDPGTNVWTQKATLGGLGRRAASAFSIGGKGYIGLGYVTLLGNVTDFWEYDPVTDVWTQKADFAGVARDVPVAFAIGSKGYIGTGFDTENNDILNDFWEYDPVTNSWTQKANFAGTPRFYASGFSIGNKGYLGVGYDNITPYPEDFWEYDQATNSWIPISSFGGGPREALVCFTINGKAYAGQGQDDNGNTMSDFWEYTPGCTAFSVYADADTDGFGSISNSLYLTDCIVPNGYIFDSTDCNDSNADVHPGVAEACNVIDDDCDGIIDEYCDPCHWPINISSVNITSTSAKLKWDAVAEAEGYTVRYKVADNGVWKYGTTYGNSKPIGGLLPQTNYQWQVKTFCTIHPVKASGWSPKHVFTTAPLRSGNESAKQISFTIYPNPAADQATIEFTVIQISYVHVFVCDMSGKEILTLLNDELPAGDHSLHLNTSEFAKGVYVMKMISYFGMENKKLVIE